MKETPQTSRIYYAAGPGDVVTTLRHWLKGEDDPRQFARTYSAQFFDVTARRGAEALVVSTAEVADAMSGRGITAVNRPLPRSGWLPRQIISGCRLWADLFRFRPGAAVVAEGTTFWTLLLPLNWLGFRIVPTIHCVLYPASRRRGWFRRCFDAVERLALKSLAPVCLTASAEIEEQLAPGQRVCRFWPTYRGERFDALAPAMAQGPFQLLYVGRIEDDKGVFDLLDAMSALHQTVDRGIRLDLCGTGSAMDRLISEIAARRLDRVVSPMGHCSVEKLAECLGRSHALVVPTTSRFVEGFNQVIVEGVLAGRPVIATSVCPSARLMGGAVTVIPPDEPESIIAAVRDLIESQARYAAAVAATAGVGREYFSESHSWAGRFERCLNELSPGTPADGGMAVAKNHFSN